MEAATAIEARPTLATLASWTGRATLATGRGADLATGLATADARTARAILDEGE